MRQAVDTSHTVSPTLK